MMLHDGENISEKQWTLFASNLLERNTHFIIVIFFHCLICSICINTELYSKNVIVHRQTYDSYVDNSVSLHHDLLNTVLFLDQL